jgi:hypothetical protein
MLKINFSETHAEERWILHGRLTNPWVQELRAYWKKNHRADVGRARIVDLDEANLVEAQLNERLALVQLYQALGGGWQQKLAGTKRSLSREKNHL